MGNNNNVKYCQTFECNYLNRLPVEEFFKRRGLSSFSVEYLENLAPC